MLQNDLRLMSGRGERREEVEGEAMRPKGGAIPRSKLYSYRSECAVG